MKKKTIFIILGVVLGVIVLVGGIIVLVSVLAVNKSRSNSEKVEIEGELSSLELEALMYYGDNMEYPSKLSDFTDVTSVKGFPVKYAVTGEDSICFQVKYSDGSIIAVPEGCEITER